MNVSRILNIILIFILTLVLFSSCGDSGNVPTSGNGWAFDENGNLLGKQWMLDENGTLIGNGWKLDETGVMTGQGWTIDENGTLSGNGWYMDDDGRLVGDDVWFVNLQGTLIGYTSTEDRDKYLSENDDTIQNANWYVVNGVLTGDTFYMDPMTRDIIILYDHPLPGIDYDDEETESTDEETESTEE